MKLVLIGFLTFVSITAIANDEFVFDCSCKQSECKDLSDLSITIGDKIEGDVSSEDGEFSANFTLKSVNKNVPNEFLNTHARYTISSRREYLPSFFDKSDILLEKSMLSGGRRIVGPARNKFAGSVIVVNQKGKPQLKYGCTLRR